MVRRYIHQIRVRGIVVLLLSVVACTEEVDWELKYIEEPLLVVEGKVTNRKEPHEVKLSLPVYEMNGTPDPVRGAFVRIYDGSEYYSLPEVPGSPGTYRTDSLWAGVINKGYQLQIRYRERNYAALAFMRAGTPFQPMRVVKVSDDPLLFEAVIADSEEPSVVRLALDWSGVPGYDTLPDEETHALILHYSLNSVDVNRLFAPPKEHVRFPPGTQVYREKESVSPAYEEFLRGMLSETDWRGGVFDVQPGNARTNLSEGATGYFTATTVIRDSLVVE